MDSKIIRWGFIGCGSVVESKSGQAFLNVRNSTIHAIMRRDLQKALESAEKFGSPFYYDNIHDLLKNQEIDAVYICTPPGLHFEHAMLCCEARKATYIEKPFARNYDEANKIVGAFKNSGVPLFVAHYRRALPRFIEIKRILESGEIGKPIEVDFRVTRIYDQNNTRTWLYDPVLSGGGRFFDIAPHTIDILVYLLGDFIEVSGIAANNCDDYLVEDVVSMSFKTERGIVGTANFNSISGVKNDLLTIYGTLGEIAFSVHSSDLISIKSNKGERVVEIKTPEFIEEPLIETIVYDLLGKGTCPSTGADALPTVRIIDTVLDSYYGGRQRDFWNYPETWNR